MSLGSPRTFHFSPPPLRFSPPPSGGFPPRAFPLSTFPFPSQFGRQSNGYERVAAIRLLTYVEIH